MNKIEYEKYIAENKIRMEKGYLTRSERETLKKMIDNPKNYIKEDVSPIIKKGLPIVMDRAVLSKPCAKVVAEDDIKGIVQSLKDSLSGKPGAVGLSAPQIGIQKCISLISIPSVNKETNTLEYKELILINPKITEYDRLIPINGEGCVSFPGIRVNTERYVYCTVEYFDAELKPQVAAVQDMESFACQHEIDHLNGITLFDRKRKAR